MAGLSGYPDKTGIHHNRASRRPIRLTDAEIAELREKFRKSGERARQQLAIDPELTHLRSPGGWPDAATMCKQPVGANRVWAG